MTGRIEQDKHRTPEGWRVDHSVLIDQLDLAARDHNALQGGAMDVRAALVDAEDVELR